jgi:hypothetical protein
VKAIIDSGFSSLLVFIPAVVLFLILLIEADWSVDTQSMLADKTGKLFSFTPISTFELPALDQVYTASRDRPIHVPGRRPPLVAVNKPVGTVNRSTMTKGVYTLVGVILTGEKNTALLKHNQTNVVVRVVEGQAVGGMQLEKLEARKVILKKGSEREELWLRL